MAVPYDTLVRRYFYNTAGLSFNSGNRDLVKGVQAIFDRDWHSMYAVPLPETMAELRQLA